MMDYLMMDRLAHIEMNERLQSFERERWGEAFGRTNRLQTAMVALTRRVRTAVQRTSGPTQPARTPVTASQEVARVNC